MKHIFFVHSHITFLVSKQYILEQRLAAEDCIFFLSRKYQIAEEYSGLYSTAIAVDDLSQFRINHLSPIYNFRRYKSNLSDFENWIMKITSGGDFMCYTFYTASHFVSLMITMPQCQGYYIIEEGYSAYVDKKILRKQYVGIKQYLIYRILVLLFPRFYLLKDFCFSTKSDKFKGTIATSKEAFSYISGNKVILQTPFDKSHLDVKPTAILSIDLTLAVNSIPNEEIEQVFQHIKKHVLSRHPDGVLAFKYHPYYYKDLSHKESIATLLVKTFSDSTLQLYEIPKQYALENILNEYHCDFYSDFSSVGIYASTMGCLCYSFADYLDKLSTVRSYKKKVKQQPSIMKRIYRQI